MIRQRIRPRQHDAEREAEPAGDRGEVIHAIERRQRRKEPKQRLEAARLELSVLEQVHRARGGSRGECRDPDEAQRDVREQPHAAYAVRRATGRQADEVRADCRDRRQRRGNERQTDVTRQHLDDEQRQREHQPGERKRRPEAGERNGARPKREAEQRRAMRHDPKRENGDNARDRSTHGTRKRHRGEGRGAEVT